ncbi:prolyl oligopeptidase family serine peptidase [Steroidobacter sp.]|uniref:prolyl oligopeptidase family serine peptidase n=1 Tax=Steroidobacter sp. TaxID=1978227 RepID=UPI001A3DF0E2|nr:prolyl oligopeptidase family serine peptidase [Steroidobacter sp.]MBL8271690.1 prolyl oligopeptidase family serine peptidase [Steroidobacter sp.]
MQTLAALVRCALILSCGALATVDSSSAADQRGWTVRDIVETGHITSTALDEQRRRVAFVFKRGSVDQGKVRFSLYVVAADGSAAPRKMFEADYLDDVAARPNSDRWTVRADLGQGVQLYELDEQGGVRPVVVTEQTGAVGGFGGLLQTSHDETRQTGVVSYGWSPDGSALWYSRLRLRSPAEKHAVANAGVVYNSATMSSLQFHKDLPAMAGTELRLWQPNQDRLLTHVPAGAMDDFLRFSRDSVSWSGDGKRLQYSDSDSTKDGRREFLRMSVDIASGKSQRAANAGALEAMYASALPDGNSFLTVRDEGKGRRLVQLDLAGKVLKDHGTVEYLRLGGSFGSSWSAKGNRAVLGVFYRDHNGLMLFPEVPANAAWAKRRDHLSNCTFSQDLAYGTCVRESLTEPQELVAIVPDRGEMTTIARPNAALDEIEPLRSERREWTGKSGGVSDGYVTYPRNFVSGKRYPVMVVTHGGDARNRFAYFGFQAEAPVQVFAESGYVVLSVNDPITNARTRQSRDKFLHTDGNADVEAMQFYKHIEPLEGLEAAVQWAVDAGIADATQAGIAGYSRGCEMVEYALSQSKTFKAGANGDAGGWGPGGFWFTGSDNIVGLYRGMFGGSPYDARAVDNYRKHSAVFRAEQFSGALLQQSAARSAMFGLELHMMLREAKVPNEFVFFPEEAHIFWHPQRRAAAMNRSLDWFNYWLLGKRDASPDKLDQYARWDAMANEWRAAGQRSGS